MPRLAYLKVGLVWLGALAAANITYVLIPPGTDLPSYQAEAGAAGESSLVELGGMLVLQGLLAATTAGVVLGIGIRNGAWKHIAALGAVTAVLAVVFSVGSSCWMLLSIQMIGLAYGYAVGGLIGGAIRQRVVK